MRWCALGVALVTFLLTVGGYLNGYDPAVEGLQLAERYTWLPDLGLAWSVGAEGISMPLILLTSLITALAALAAWPVTFKPKLFYFLLLAMDGGQIAVFAVQDMLLWCSPATDGASDPEALAQVRAPTSLNLSASCCHCSGSGGSGLPPHGSTCWPAVPVVAVGGIEPLAHTGWLRVGVDVAQRGQHPPGDQSCPAVAACSTG